MTSNTDQARLLKGKALKELSKLPVEDQIALLDNLIDSIRAYKKGKSASVDLLDSTIEELSNKL